MEIAPLASSIPTQPDFVTVIAGPCSAESEAQIMQTAHALAKDKRVGAFRAGVWKPRTRPGGFAGLGNVALPWLARVRKETDLKVAVEVATAAHVEQCLEAGIDILWVGARTTVNPFSVQEIADALAGVDIPVLVKNPVSPDLGLWIGALERIHMAGVNKLAAVHRGFSQYEPGRYRNPPEWQIAIELRERVPHLSLLCDPSHIGGDATLIAPLAQTAMDLRYDGLMIETHPDPAHALSDAKQQITPAELSAMLDDLLLDTTTPLLSLPDSILHLRQEIDVLDAEVVRLLAARLQLATDIGHIKAEEHIPILQMERWAHILKTRTEQARSLGLDETLVKRLYQLVHVASLQAQERGAAVKANLVS